MKLKHLGYLILALFISACATFEPQFKTEFKSHQPIKKEIAHTFYLIGDAGNSPKKGISKGLQFLKDNIKDAPKESTLIFLGDNVYEKGIPKKKKKKKYKRAKHKLKVQTDVAKDFNGNAIFIPGNHDWYSGLSGLKRQEELVEKALSKSSFLPNNGCPLEKVKITDDIVLIIVDTEWYLADWDDHPNINDNCEIKTRIKFLDEFEGLIKKARGKTTIVALHHPMYSYGSHGGRYSFSSHMKPTPILGSVKNLIRKTSGLSKADLQNKKYDELKKHIVTIAQENEKTILVSGHDHNLQYIVKDNLPQIVSGSGSKETETKLTGSALFTYGAQGFAKLTVYKDGSSSVAFLTADDNKVVFETQVLKKDEKKNFTTYPSVKIKSKKASVYTQEEVTKSGFYRYMWGERYRKYFGTEVDAPAVDLDTLFGGLTPVRKGGGHQSKSLRMKDKQGREYVMRAIRKNAVQYLQAVAFKTQYIEGLYDDTSVEDLLMDVFTGSHPYAPFTIGTLSDAVGIYHTNPVLYYIPKQNALGHFNEDFGNELYMIEERAASGHGDKASFGFANEVISTDDMMLKIDKDEDHILDEQAYIKARIFDMLIGDWDRHEDQWRWAKFKIDGKTVYRPIPRDRDQAFSIMGDGALLKFATNKVPTLRLMRAYSEELESPAAFNLEPYPLDMALITSATKKDWDAQVKHIQNNITDDVITQAFKFFPKEVQDETIDIIKRKLKGRIKNLQKISDDYYYYMNKFVVVKGTLKDDWFDIKRLPNGDTEITAYRIKKGKKADVFHKKTYKIDETREIWIYGLGDENIFDVTGNSSKYIKLKIIGGRDKDTYNVVNTKKVKVYDYKSRKNKFTNDKTNKKLTDHYDTNVYNYKKLKNSANFISPSIGFNPDDGIKIGLSNNIIINGFERNPFSSQHIISANYYFATSGYELDYKGEIARVFGNWNLGIKAGFNSPNFAINFFGFGSNSSNLEASGTQDMDYNRVRIGQLNFGTSINYVSELGANINLGINYQNYEVENTVGRFINTFNANNAIFTNQKFLNAEASYHFINSNNHTYTTNGMEANLKVGYTTNLENTNNFGYIIPSISFDQKLTSNGRFVFATKLHSHFTLGDGYEFYQAASIGGNNFGLRGFRNQRFTDKNSFYHSSDLRFDLKRFKTGFVPINLGVYAGFDYGTVWGGNFPGSNLSTTSWHTSYGGGVFFSLANMLGANLAFFDSADGTRLAVGLGFKF